MDFEIELCRSRKLGLVLGKIIESLALIAEQLDKPTPNFVLEPSDFMVPNDISDTVQNIFVHLVRNSIDHGIESPEERSKQGKTIEGNIVIHAKKENGNIVCELKDDGRGLNMERMREKALELGMTLDSITDDDLAEVIFHSGFSTAEKLTTVSGRGVGMDAVRKFAEDLGGQVTLELLSERDEKGYCPFSTVVKLPTEMPQSS